MPNAKVRLWSIAAGIGCAMSALAVHGDEAQTVRAIWKSQEIQFYYQITESDFSCDGFKRKVTRILKALGAADAEVLIGAADCGSSSGVARRPLVSLRVRAPVEATPEAIAEHTRELAARAQGDTATAVDEQPFAAAWQPVSLSRGRLGLEPTDCGLVDHLRQLVLPQLAVRIVEDAVDCWSGSVSSGQPKLRVDALRAEGA